MSITQEAFFLPTAKGRRFCIWRAPPEHERTRACIVHVPPFAEEMNKTRRMAAWTARELAAHGVGVMQIDLFGCGESDGDFGDAAWDDWIADIVAATQWAGVRASGPLWLWGVRAGALLAAAAMTRLERMPALLLWQPVLSGKQHLTQFLRLKLTADLRSEANAGNRTEDLHRQLGAGESVEVAGYTLAPALASGMGSAVLALPADARPPVTWLEVQASEAPELSPASQARIADWREKGIDVDARALSGPGFWQTVEIEDCPALVEASVAAVARHDAHELPRDSVFL